MRKLLCVLAILAFVTPAMGQLVFSENWDSYPTKVVPPAPWDIIPGYSSLWVESTISRTSPNNLLPNNKGYDGADKGVYSLIDGGAAWNGCDEVPLLVQYYLRTNDGKQRKFEDIYVEVSLGDVHAPTRTTVLAEPIPVLAWCKPLDVNEKVTPAYFDGKQWNTAGSRVHQTWQRVRMIVNTDTVDIDISSGGGPYNSPREYLGGFDRISIRTTDYTYKSNTVLDDVLVAGGYPTAPVALPLDILPNDCPNEFTMNLKGNGRLPMTIFGSADLDVTTIDVSTISIAGVAPVKVTVDEDGTPGAAVCDCSSGAADGYDDLKLQFKRTDLIAALGLDLEDPYTEVEITVTGELPGCLTFEATDCVTLVPVD